MGIKNPDSGTYCDATDARRCQRANLLPGQHPKCIAEKPTLIGYNAAPCKAELAEIPTMGVDSAAAYGLAELEAATPNKFASDGF